MAEGGDAKSQKWPGEGTRKRQKRDAATASRKGRRAIQRVDKFIAMAMLLGPTMNDDQKMRVRAAMGMPRAPPPLPPAPASASAHTPPPIAPPCPPSTPPRLPKPPALPPPPTTPPPIMTPCE